jgi:hypothetical protein
MTNTTNANWFKGSTFSIIDSRTGARLRAATEQEAAVYINRGPCFTNAIRLGDGISVDVDSRECSSDELQGWMD